MAETGDAILELLYRSVAELNEGLPPDKQLPPSLDTPLFGSDRLDSLGLTNLLLTAEQHIEQELGVTVSLLDERLLGAEPNPLATLGTLAAHVARELEAQRASAVR